MVRSIKPLPVKAQVITLHAQGRTIADITRELNLSRNTVKRILTETQANQIASNSIESALRKSGITHETIAAKFRDLQEAKDVRLATFEGKFTDRVEVADGGVQFRATEALAKIAGMFPREDTSLVAQLFVRLPDAELVAGHGKLCKCEECCKAWESIPNAEVIEP